MAESYPNGMQQHSSSYLALSMPMARFRKFCGILGIPEIKKAEKKNVIFFQHLFLIDIKVYKIRQKGLKKIYKNSTGLCMC